MTLKYRTEIQNWNRVVYNLCQVDGKLAYYLFCDTKCTRLLEILIYFLSNVDDLQQLLQLRNIHRPRSFGRSQNIFSNTNNNNNNNNNNKNYYNGITNNITSVN